MDDSEADRWKIKKEVSLGDIIAFTMAFCSVIYAWSTLDKRQAVTEDRLQVFQTQQQAIDKRQDEENTRYQARIDASLEKINSKMDRLIERKVP